MKEIETIYEFIQTNGEGNTITIDLKIDNMLYQGCAEEITDILKSLNGVKKVKTKWVQVEYNPLQINESKIEIALIKSGYAPKKSVT